MDYSIGMNPWFFDCAFEGNLIKVKDGNVSESTSPQNATIL
jgi:hypothetical protein